MYGKWEKLTERLLTKLRASFKLGEYNPPPSISYLVRTNDRKSAEEFKTYWTYSWGNFQAKFPLRVYSKNYFYSGESQLKSSSILSAAVSNAAISPFPPETPVFHLDAYSTLHRKTLTRISAIRHLRTVWFLTWQLHSVDRYFQARKARVSYLGRGFFKFLSFSARFLKV